MTEESHLPFDESPFVTIVNEVGVTESTSVIRIIEASDTISDEFTANSFVNSYLSAKQMNDEALANQVLNKLQIEIKDDSLKEKVRKAIATRELLGSETFAGWEEALTPVSDEAKYRVLKNGKAEFTAEGKSLLEKKQIGTLNLFNRVFNWAADTNKLKIGETQYENLTEYTDAIKSQLLDSLIVEKGNKKFFNKDPKISIEMNGLKEKKATDLLASMREKNNKLALETYSLIKNSFSPNSDVLSLNTEGLDLMNSKIAALVKMELDGEIDADQKVEKENLEAQRMILATMIDSYYAHVKSLLNKDKLKTGRETVAFAISHFDMDMTKQRENVYISLVGVPNAGKGTGLGMLDLIAYGAGTDGVAGRGLFHEHFELVMRTWDTARDSNFGMMHLMDPIFETGAIGMRSLLDKRGFQNAAMITDGYPRSESQMQVYLEIPPEKGRLVVVDLDDGIAMERIVSRWIEKLNSNSPLRPDDLKTITTKNVQAVELEEVLSEIEKLTDTNLSSAEKGKVISEILKEKGYILSPKGRQVDYRSSIRITSPIFLQHGVEINYVDTGSFEKLDTEISFREMFGKDSVSEAAKLKWNKYENLLREVDSSIETAIKDGTKFKFIAPNDFYKKQRNLEEGILLLKDRSGRTYKAVATSKESGKVFIKELNREVSIGEIARLFTGMQVIFPKSSQGKEYVSLVKSRARIAKGSLNNKQVVEKFNPEV